MNLDDAPAAFESFKEVFRILKEQSITAVRDQYTGIVISAWLAGDKETAFEYTKQLAAIEPSFFAPGGLDKLDWPQKESVPFKAAVAAAIKRDPTLRKP